jgi:hypothetical protein
MRLQKPTAERESETIFTRKVSNLRFFFQFVSFLVLPLTFAFALYELLLLLFLRLWN